MIVLMMMINYGYDDDDYDDEYDDFDDSKPAYPLALGISLAVCL